MEEVSNDKPDLKEKDKVIRKGVRNLELCASMLFPTIDTKQSVRVHHRVKVELDDSLG